MLAIDMMLLLSLLALLFAAIPAYLYFRNVSVFRKLPPDDGASMSVSVLIPARNEADNIGACIDSVLESADENAEVVVLDDHSEDETADIVTATGQRDSRVRLAKGAKLPAGWNGKQHACWQLAKEARGGLLVFLDADVRLAPDALPRIAGAMSKADTQLLSGFPRQITGSLVERMLIPLIHFVLLGFLSLRHMRRVQMPKFAAGCGQLFVTPREAYFQSGGHAAIRSSRHDGIKLPRLYMAEGLRVDVFDATDLASVRMYHGARATWTGLAKNADEGVASLGLILPVTSLLLGGQVLPVALLAFAWATRQPVELQAIAAVATALGYFPRFDAARRFRQSVVGALLHPLSVLLFLAIQWSALIGSLTGHQTEWKGRPAVTSSSP